MIDEAEIRSVSSPHVSASPCKLCRLEDRANCDHYFDRVITRQQERIILGGRLTQAREQNWLTRRARLNLWAEGGPLSQRAF